MVAAALPSGSPSAAAGMLSSAQGAASFASLLAAGSGDCGGVALPAWGESGSLELLATFAFATGDDGPAVLAPMLSPRWWSLLCSLSSSCGPRHRRCCCCWLPSFARAPCSPGSCCGWSRSSGVGACSTDSHGVTILSHSPSSGGLHFSTVTSGSMPSSSMASLCLFSVTDSVSLIACLPTSGYKERYAREPAPVLARACRTSLLSVSVSVLSALDSAARRAGFSALSLRLCRRPPSTSS
mmetsp:Transcript_2542/g.9169  ORF Transcript_2542/g.9169 Transcript_2542/m.9169 type:complete len:240 (+) Transcript_2542:352-1071(+)